MWWRSISSFQLRSPSDACFAVDPTMSVNITVARTVVNEARGRSAPMKSRTWSAHAGASSNVHPSPGISRTSAAGILEAMYSASSTPFLLSLCTSSRVGVPTASSTPLTSVSYQIRDSSCATSGVHAFRLCIAMCSVDS